MKICPLEEVECEFQDVGCVGKFRREEEEEHMREKSQAHLTMMAAASAKMKQELLNQKKELEGKLKENEENFEKKLQAVKMYFEEMLQVQQKTIEEFKAEAIRNLQKVKIPAHVPKVPQSFTLDNYSQEKQSNSDWNSPIMYTHEGGYKFCVRIYAHGVDFTLLALKGEYDDQLKWPATARFTITLINHHPDGHNKKVAPTVSWKRPAKDYERMCTEGDIYGGDVHRLVSSTKLKRQYRPYEDEDEDLRYKEPIEYLKGDALHFKVDDIIFF